MATMKIAATALYHSWRHDCKNQVAIPAKGYLHYQKPHPCYLYTRREGDFVRRHLASFWPVLSKEHFQLHRWVWANRFGQRNLYLCWCTSQDDGVEVVFRRERWKLQGSAEARWFFSPFNGRTYPLRTGLLNILQAWQKIKWPRKPSSNSRTKGPMW